MARLRFCRVAVRSDAIPPWAPARWRAAVRHLAAILLAPGGYGFDSKGVEMDGWHPRPVELASEELPAENNDEPMPHVLPIAPPFHARKSRSSQAREVIHFSTARIEFRRVRVQFFGYDRMCRLDLDRPVRYRSFRF